MYDIVCLFDMLDYLIYITFILYENLDFLLQAVGPIHFDWTYSLWVSFTRFKLRIPHYIYSGTIPDDHILDQFLHLQMKIKR